MLVQAANTRSAYLSSFHAFVLANALRRPILVYGDRFVRGRDGEPYAPSDVRGYEAPGWRGGGRGVLMIMPAIVVE